MDDGLADKQREQFEKEHEAYMQETKAQREKTRGAGRRKSTKPEKARASSKSSSTADVTLQATEKV